MTNPETSQLPTLNYEKGLATYGSDESVYNSFLSSFETMTLDPKILEMNANWKSSNYPQMERICFDLKGATGTLAADKLNSICQQQGDICKVGEPQAVDTIYGLFQQESRELKFAINKATGLDIHLGEIDEIFREFSKRTQMGKSNIQAETGQEPPVCDCQVF